MTTIRTPEDEQDQPGDFYPPFTEGWWYQGQTYAGHSDFAVDWNRRTRTGGWLDDRGDPVLAAADGTVAETTPVDGYVAIDHYGGLWRTEYRHMQPVSVKPGDKVQRGDRIGSIGEAGNAPNGTHLHHVHYRRDKVGQPWKAVKQRFLGQPVEVSVSDSDTRPAGWNPPPAVMVQGPEPRATWEGAFREASKALAKAEKTAADAVTAKGAAEDALAQEKAARLLAQTAADELRTALSEAQAALTACQNATPPDCTTAVQQEHDRMVALVEAGAADLVAALR